MIANASKDLDRCSTEQSAGTDREVWGRV